MHHLKVLKANHLVVVAEINILDWKDYEKYKFKINEAGELIINSKGTDHAVTGKVKQQGFWLVVDKGSVNGYQLEGALLEIDGNSIEGESFRFGKTIFGNEDIGMLASFEYDKAEQKLGIKSKYDDERTIFYKRGDDIKKISCMGDGKIIFYENQESLQKVEHSAYSRESLQESLQ